MLLVTLTGCMYHGRLRRGIFNEPGQPERIEASILVLSDKIMPAQISISDPDSAALYGFTLDVSDAVMVAATDALGTLFTRADAGPHRLEDKYHFTAEVKLVSKLTRVDCDDALHNWEQVGARQNGLCTQLTLTLHRAGQDKPIGEFSAKRWEVFARPGTASVVRWINEHTLYLFSPVLIPAYTQLQGNVLRQILERQISGNLTQIMEEISGQKEKLQPLPAQSNATMR